MRQESDCIGETFLPKRQENGRAMQRQTAAAIGVSRRGDENE